MITEPAKEGRDWTWADMLSTYRFWGLFAFFVLMGLAYIMFLQASHFHLRDYVESMGGSPTETGWFEYTRNWISAMGIAFGFYLAWLASRWRSVAVLLLMGILQAVLCLLLEVSGSLVINYVASFASKAVLIPVLVGVPALIAGNRAGATVFGVTFGLAIAAKEYFFFPSMFYAVNEVGMTLSIIIFSVAAVAFLIPVKRSLFTGPPPEREKTLPYKRRSPVVTALLCMFVPFYIIYWFYRAFAETRELTGARGILTGRGGALLGLLVPLLLPVMNTDLVDALNPAVKENEQPRRPWAVAVWTILLPPVGCGLVQSLMNRAAYGPAAGEEEKLSEA
ncbi:MAG: hypothetical protein R6V10_05680 [bacterium]